MKQFRLLLFLALSVVIFSCSKDEDPTPASSSLETATLSLSANATVVSAPAAMRASTDDYAVMASGYVQSVNGMTNYLSMFTVPAGAVKTSAGITASNARVASTQKEYLVYTWSDANNGTVAYQISEESGKYVFELFFKAKSASSWLRYLYAEEMKDKSAGAMKVYDIFTGGPTTSVLVSYSWAKSGDVLNFTMEVPDPDFSYKIVISVNLKTNSGSVSYYLGGVKWYDMIWDTKGNGTWSWYEEDGKTVSESGKWTV